MISNLFGNAGAPQPAEKEERIWRVSEVLGLARKQLEGRFSHVAILGEISAFKAWRSGHWYFALKDQKSSLSAVMFHGANKKVPFDVADGLEVVAHGRLTIHPERSQIQIMVERLEPLGAGALALAFEQLKEKLQKEGLFNAEHKKPLPPFPQTIGLVTSPQGAALRDMLRVLNERWPGLKILLSPTRVQGKGSALEIARAIQLCDASGHCDVIIVARGGGSLEDLWAFNEEEVAQAIFHAQTPIVSGVGHATDTTIADFVADRAVATPTHAASVVPEKHHLVQTILLAHDKIEKSVKRQLREGKQHLALLRKSLPKPQILLLQQKQLLDELERRAHEQTLQILNAQKHRLRQTEERLKSKHPILMLKNNRFTLAQTKERLEAHHPQKGIEKARAALIKNNGLLNSAITAKLYTAQKTFATQAAALDMLSPLAVLHRGYTLVQKNGELVSKCDRLQKGETITIQFSDGLAQATVDEIQKTKEQQ